MSVLEQKYLALLAEAQARKMPDIANIQLCFQVLSLAGSIDRDCAALLAPHGLSEGRFILLFMLEAAGCGLPAYELAKRAGITPATVTGLLDGLEREALLTRENHPTDRRALLAQLTPQGKRLAKKLFAEHAQWMASLFSGLDGDERALLSQLLAKVAKGATHVDRSEP